MLMRTTAKTATKTPDADLDHDDDDHDDDDHDDDDNDDDDHDDGEDGYDDDDDNLLSCSRESNCMN